MGLALCTLACLTCLAVAPIDRVDGVPDREPEWIHVSHDQFPLSFDITREHSLQRVGVFSMARARSDSDRVIEVDLFGLHPLPHRLAAVQVAFFWVMDRYKGADEQSLAGLHARIQDSETVESFLRAVFYSRMEVELRDRGARFVDGHHVVHWGDRGETKLPNLLSLCSVHHQYVHECGFKVRAIGDGQFEFRDPKGALVTVSGSHGAASPPHKPALRRILSASAQARP